MTIKKTIAVSLLAAALAFTTQAFAGLGPIVSQAYELSLSDFRAPATANGTASFRTCADCERKVVRVTTGTRYSVNGKAARLEAFRKAIAAADDRNEATVVVLHHLESDTIESISVSY